MKPKKEEASETLNEFGNIAEDTEEKKMAHSYHYKNLLMKKSTNTNRKGGGRHN